eukprot:TRINITY_DN562_c3_g1_i1.p1 TRINITY_DN562_c3_g1~~TRINITY_DN562_c3_g1_i1.p1  ORF type:complete len:1515 (-),score=244.31 TRINITY_DN562_c3_g1_i1:27-4571(-)
METFNLNILDDSRDSSYSTPLCKIIMAEFLTVVRIYDVASNPTANYLDTMIMIGTILLQFHNEQLSSYEPFIEPWGLQLKLTQSETKIGIHMTALELINVNFTKPFLETIFNIVDLSKTLQQHFEKQVDKTKALSMLPSSPKLLRRGSVSSHAGPIERSDVNFFPFLLRNKTGKPIRFWTKREDQKKTLKDGDEIPITSEESSRRSVARKLSFQVISGTSDKYQYDKTVADIRYDVVGKRSYSVSRNSKGLRAIVQIDYTADSKIITIRSDRVVKNNTQCNLEISLLHKGSRLPQTFPLPFGSYFPIPIDVEFDEISVRPTEGEYSWSELKPGRDSHYAMMFCNGAAGNDFWGCSAVVPEEEEDHWLNIHPPCHFENLLPVPLTLNLVSASTKKALLSESLKPGETLDHFLFASKNMKDVIMFIQIDEHTDSKQGQVFEDINHDTHFIKTTRKYSVKTTDHQKVRIWGDHVTDSKTRTRMCLIYTKYWLTNCTGLPIRFYKVNGILGEDVLLPGQTSSSSPLVGDPRRWYQFDLKGASENSTSHPSGLTPVGTPCSRLIYGFDNKLRIAVADSVCSDSFPLGVTNEGRVEIPDTVSNRLYAFSVVVTPGPGRFFSMRTAKIYPATIIVNMTGHSVSYRQENDDKNSSLGWILQHEEQIPFHWPNKDIDTKALQIKVGSDSKEDTMRSDWSLGFNIDDVSDFQVRLRNTRKQKRYMGVNVSVRLLNGTNYVTLSGDQIPIYRISNQSSVDFQICQKGVSEGSGQVIHSYNTVPFYWDKPQQSDKTLLLSTGNSSPKEIKLDVIAKYPTIRVGRSKITCEVVADGPTKVLHLYEKDRAGSSSDTESGAENRVFSERIVSVQVKVSMAGIGVCLIHERRSLLYFALQSIDLDFEQSNVDRIVEATIHTAQIDNQLYRTPFPVILFDTSPEKTPFIKFSLLQDTRYDKINFIRYLGFLVQEMDIMVDGIFLLHFVQFMMDITSHVYKRFGIDLEAQLLEQKEYMLFLPPRVLERSNWYYFELLHINPIKASISHYSATEDEQVADDVLGILSIFHFVGMLTDLDRAPLALNGLMMESVFSNQTDLVNLITKHYSTSILAQSYLIIGSADFLGNPVSLISNLGTGVHDFFYEPIKGIVSSPKDFGMGIAKGTASLLRNSVFAIFDTASKLTGTLAKIGVAATFDEQYRRARARTNQHKARHVGEGFVLGFRDLGVGLYKGITGIVTAPIEGAMKDGAAGFLKGVGIGFAGVLIKPVVGVADLATRTAEGIKNTTKMGSVMKIKAPIRPPRYFGADGLLTIYDYKRALGQKLLNMANRGNYRQEIYLHHVALTEGKYLLVTEKNIMLIEPAKLEAVEGRFITAFHYGMKDIVDIKPGKYNKIILYFKTKQYSRGIQVESQEIDLDMKVEADKYHVVEKLIYHCQPKGLNSFTTVANDMEVSLYSFASSSTRLRNRRATMDVSESGDDVHKILKRRQEGQTSESDPLIKRANREHVQELDGCGGMWKDCTTCTCCKTCHIQ